MGILYYIFLDWVTYGCSAFLDIRIRFLSADAYILLIFLVTIEILYEFLPFIRNELIKQ